MSKSPKSVRIGLPQALGFLSKAVLSILIVLTLAAAIPLQVRDPLWYLKMSQVIIDYSIALLFGISCAVGESLFRRAATGECPAVWAGTGSQISVVIFAKASQCGVGPLYRFDSTPDGCFWLAMAAIKPAGQAGVAIGRIQC